MRATEILGATVVDAAGGTVAPVRDIRLVERGGRFRVAGLVVGDGFLAAVAHRTGFAAGRVAGPWLFRVLTRSAVRRARFVPVENVVSWEEGLLRLDVAAEDLPLLTEVDGR